jgi:uncharacterized protein
MRQDEIRVHEGGLGERRTPGNPFQYGREADVLVDRIDELARVLRVSQECGTLFLIGPRRFGKTSILRAAEARLTDAGKVALRYDAEAFDDLGSLSAALLSGAVRRYSSALDRAQAIARKFFVALKPSLTLDPSDGKITVAVGVEPGGRLGAISLFTDVLNGIDGLAAEDGRPALVMIDEFQQVVTEAGEKAERQIRAAVQGHRAVGHVFAGSSSRKMTEMVATSNRAFWQLGDQLHVGPIPRPAFLEFLRKGFESADATIANGALERILDLGEDVPYNVQQLASECWVVATDKRRRHLTVALVDEALGRVVSTQHVSYLQRWLPLSHAQKQTLRIVSQEPIGFELAARALQQGPPRSTMKRALEAIEALDALEHQHFLRQDLTGPKPTWRFEDPFMRVWMASLGNQ